MKKVILSILSFFTINSFAGSPLWKCVNCEGEVNVLGSPYDFYTNIPMYILLFIMFGLLAPLYLKILLRNFKITNGKILLISLLIKTLVLIGFPSIIYFKDQSIKDQTLTFAGTKVLIDKTVEYIVEDGKLYNSEDKNRTKPLMFNGNWLSDTYGGNGYIFKKDKLYQIKENNAYLVK